ncbi:unnamed protein product [Sphagnum compactum]
MPRKWRKAAFEDDDDVYGDYDDDYEYEEEEYGDDQEATSTSDVWRCSVCTYDNAVDLQSCDICGVARHNPADFLPTSKKASAKHQSKPVAPPSALARALFSSLPHSKVKEARPFLQFRGDHATGSRLKDGGPLGSHSLFSWSPPLSMSRDSGIVPFQFDTPSPDDKVLGSQSGMRGSAKGNSNPANVSKTAAVSVSKSVPASKKTAMTQTMVTTSSSKHEGITEGHGKRTMQNGSSADSRKDVNLVESMRSVTLDGDHKDQQKGRELNEAPQVAVKRMPVDMYVPEAWMLPEAKKQKKQLLHLIVVGHVDAGKSTLMGHILHLLGRISQKDMHKNERESKQQGKGSFAYAWVLDEGSEERARGVTMTIAVAHFETPKLRVVLLDAPGHKDFVPNMISGASQADAAILVVDASTGAFEAGLEGEGQGGGQTREHAQLVRSLGVEQLVVAVNKLDIVGYSKERFDFIKSTLQPFLKHCGFKDAAVQWVPVSATDGQNLTSAPTEEAFRTWYAGANLMESVDMLEPPVRLTARPLRLVIAEVMRTRSLGPAALAGKLESGAIRIGSKVRVMPSGEIATIKAIEQEGKPLTVAMAGDGVDIGLTGVEAGMLSPGGVLCHPDFPIPVASRFEVRVLTLGITIPILPGSQVVFHAHHVRRPARISQLISLLDPKTGGIIRQRPRHLTANQSAVIEVVPDELVCIEEYADFRGLGRVALRDGGKTIAVGIIVHIISMK